MSGYRLEVVEYTDPLCPWAWGSEPKLRLLRRQLEGVAEFRRVFGLLFEDEDDPAPDPDAETAWYARYVEGITAHTGAPRAVRLHRVAASSRPASLAAAAAEAQGAEVAERVLRRLRETAFVLGEPADTPARVLAALDGVPGLDRARLHADLGSAAVLERISRDRAETRRPVPDVVGLRGEGPHPGAAKETEDGYRYALPTLLFTGPGGRRAVPGWRTGAEYLAAARAVSPGLEVRPGDLAAADQLERYRSLTVTELGPEPAGRPPGALVLPTGNGPLLLHPDERAGSPLFSGPRRAHRP
ncbi:DsbA family protein [Kitasatospora sp. NPDC048540]|uniref:DsbA family protein n=1 Tax=unclassified Kitasatospora TaxID=2633591 RepID=UPI00068AF0C3|nr:DsbA family protein [Kitasatospora sp. MBT63]